MSAAMIWILIGIVLILSELLATSIVAVFLGIAAIVVGLLHHWGIIESLTTQLSVFALLSLLLLIFARRHFKKWFIGKTVDDQDGADQRFQDEIGERVTVIQDFNQGFGQVSLNGVKWDAESNDELKIGDIAWVIKNESIHLQVSKQRPSKSN